LEGQKHAQTIVSEASGSTIVQGWNLMRDDNQHKRITPTEEGVKKWEY